MKTMYIVSFGDSGSFRYYDEKMEAKAAEDIRRDIAKKFPTIANVKFFETADIKRINPEDEEKYKDYPLLDNQAIARLDDQISTEVKEAAALRELNSNAPFDKFG